MSEDQSRGRRRPSREYHSASGSPKESSGDSSSHRARKRENSPIPEEPHVKQFKKESGSPEDRASKHNKFRDSKGGTSRDDEPSTSRGIRSGATAAEGGGGDSRGNGRGGGGAKNDAVARRNRVSYEIVPTKPADVTTKQGEAGERCTLQTNYYRLQTMPQWKIFQYHVTFEPDLELIRVRRGVLSEHSKLLGGFLYDGTKLFTTNKLEQDVTVMQTKTKKGEEFVITFKLVGIIAMTDWQSLQVLNLILRRAQEGLNLQLVGRNYYDPVAKISLNEYHMQLWPGYQTSIRQHESDILLCCEVAHKVMRTETVYDILKRCTETTRDFQEDFRRQVLGLTVLTDYNNKTYRVSDIDFQSNPKKTFQMKDREISFIDYYYQRYHIRIRDPNQPLLISKAKQREMRGGNKNDDLVILVPELCRPTGLTDSMRTNFQLMRAMAQYTRMLPDRRIDRLRDFNQRLQSTAASMKVLSDWNMKLDTKLLEVTGRVLDVQKIVFRDHRKVTPGNDFDWQRSFRDNAMFTSPSRGLDRWAVIAPNRMTRDLKMFVPALMRAAGGMRMDIRSPKEVILYDDRNHSYIKAIDDAYRNDVQLIMCLVPNNNAERYASIKKKGCIDNPVPTQVITQRVASNQKGLMSIATKVAIQINCKLGYTPWMVEMPLTGLMTIGYDVVKSTRDRSKAFGALVASMDMKTNATFYSTIAECSAHDVLANSLWPMMTKALRQYQKEHQALPSRILFYRDGVGEGSLKQLVDFEVKDIVAKLEHEYKRANAEKPPMFAYVVVNKTINTRFFHRGQNPKPGTVVDDVVTLPERYDFYLVSQYVRQGTVSPTSYNIVYSNIRLAPDKMQQLTYKMTHLYYNWSGTTRVPAVCQYAKKLATLVSTCLYQPPANSLEKKLYYL